MENEKNQATIIIEEDKGSMVTIPIEHYTMLVRSDTILALLHAVKNSAKINYSTSLFEEVMKVAPSIIGQEVYRREMAKEDWDE